MVPGKDGLGICRTIRQTAGLSSVPVIFLTAKSSEADRILVCTGKIGHELRAERKKRKDTSTAIVCLEQLYPFPEKELTAEFASHGNSGDIVWVQEEPANMGAWPTMALKLPKLLDREVTAVTLPASSAPAAGSAAKHGQMHAALVERAFAG